MSIGARELDRLTIIYRKWVEGRLVGQEAKWLEEAKALLAVASDETIELERVLKLGALNAAIWQRIDETRALKLEGGTRGRERAGVLSFDLLKLNDWRAEIVGEGKFKGEAE